MDNNIEDRVRELEKQFGIIAFRNENIDNKINSLERLQETTQDLAFAVKTVASNLADMHTSIDKVESKLEKMERAPAESIQNAKQTLVNTIISNITATLLGLIGAGLVFYLSK